MNNNETNQYEDRPSLNYQVWDLNKQLFKLAIVTCFATFCIRCIKR